MKVYAPSYPPGHPKNEDTAYESAVQRDLDDEIDRAYAQALEAFSEGRRAGFTGVRFSTNPYPAGSRQHDEWHRGWREGNAQLFYRRAG